MLPGEREAWRIIQSPLTLASEKADARVRLAEIEEIRRGNAERQAQYLVRQGVCPTCGRGPS